MEQRKCERKAVSFDAVIGCQRFGLIRGRIVDLGMKGLYVQAETSIVPIGAEVTVTFQAGDRLCDDCMTVRGRVAHQNLHGFGVAFAPLDPACRDVLGRLLPAMVPVAATPRPALSAI